MIEFKLQASGIGRDTDYSKVLHGGDTLPTIYAEAKLKFFWKCSLKGH